MKTTVREPRATDDHQQTDEWIMPVALSESRSSLSGKMYRYHGMTVQDINGETVGQVDWIWHDDVTGQGDLIGVGLRWLRGTARAIPAQDVWIDHSDRTIRVAFSKDQIKSARRLSIGRAPTAREKRAVALQYRMPQLIASRRTASGAVAA